MPKNAQQLQRRWLVISHYKQGMTHLSQIQKKTGESWMYIKRTIERFEETGDVVDLPRSGRPKKLSEKTLRRVRRCLTRKKTGSLRKTAAYLKRKYNLCPSKTTIGRIAAALKLRYLVRPKKPLLTQAHQKARVQFARMRHGRHFWENVLWTDEASFALYSDTRGQWVLKGKKANPRQTTKWPYRIWVGWHLQERQNKIDPYS